MKRTLIASLAALGVLAAPAIATTTAKTTTAVTKTAKQAAKAHKKAAKVAAKQQKVAAKTAAKGRHAFHRLSSGPSGRRRRPRRAAFASMNAI